MAIAMTVGSTKIQILYETSLGSQDGTNQPQAEASSTQKSTTGDAACSP
jgi:hypothetical protein